MKDFSYDVIIIGGSYAGLAGAMSLGRSARKVLVIDAGEPCNRFTPHSHNFITHDGRPPAQIADDARNQVLKYPTVTFLKGMATGVTRQGHGFEVQTHDGARATARKLLFATGLNDLMPDMPGFAACWGKSVVHCPYCHGYEFKGMRTGILANGAAAVDYARLVRNLTADLTLFTNGAADLTPEQREKMASHHIAVIETPVSMLEHQAGSIRFVVLNDGSRVAVSALYTRPVFKQHCDLPLQLGCELLDNNLLKVDAQQKTTADGIYAAGDNNTAGRSVAAAVATGTLAGAAINKAMADEEF